MEEGGFHRSYPSVRGYDRPEKNKPDTPGYPQDPLRSRHLGTEDC